MKRHLIIWVVGILAVSIIHAVTVAHGQNQARVSVSLLSEEDLTQPEKSAIPLFIEEKKKTLHGQIQLLEDKIKVSLPNRPSFELPHYLETLVSQDGQVIVQFGDVLDQSHPQRTNIYWADNNGKPVAQLVDYFAQEALVAISDDGFTAVTGPLYQNRNSKVLSLYSPVGEKVWETILEKDQRPAILNLTQEGNHIALVTTDSTKWLTNHRLHIFDKQGKRLFSINAFRIIQKLVGVDAREHLFVQGYDDYGLVQISDGSVLWRKQEKIRMASLFGAKIDPQGQQLFLVLADFKGKTQPAYRWRLVVLNTIDGVQQASVWLPGEFPGTRNRVFEQISAERLQIRTTSKRFIYSRQIRQEDNQ